MDRIRKRGQRYKYYFNAEEKLNINAFLLVLAAEAQTAAEKSIIIDDEKRAEGLGSPRDYWIGVVKSLSWISDRVGKGIDTASFDGAVRVIAQTNTTAKTA